MEIGGEKVQLGIPDQLRGMAPMLTPLGRPGTPEEAAGGIFLLCTPWANYIHGQVLNITGGQFGGDGLVVQLRPYAKLGPRGKSQPTRSSGRFRRTCSSRNSLPHSQLGPHPLVVPTNT